MKILMARRNGLGNGLPARFLFLVFLISAALSAVSDEPGKKPLPGEDIFSGSNGIVRINITIPAEGIRRLQRYYWGNGNEKIEAKATVTESNAVYKDVAIHLKGSAGSFQSISEKPALTLNFDKYVPGQKFHGLEKISLNNSVQDPTFIEEKLCREMYEKAGVPVPRADYAVVTLNNRPLGLYVLVEGYNKQFLKRYFKNVSGNLYDGGFCREITDDLSVNSGDKPNEKSDLVRLARAAEAARRTQNLSELAQVLDVDRMLSMIALEVIQCHWDGYTMNRNNYRLYHDMDSGKMVFMPHGMDQMFGTGGMGNNMRGSPQSSIFPSAQGYVSSALLSTTEGRARYLERLAEIRTNIFKVEEITNRVYQINSRIRESSRSSPYGFKNNGTVNWLVQNIVARGESLDEQLSDPPKPAIFTNGVLRLAGWAPNQNFGNLDFANSRDGKKLLHIAANGRSCSWRTKVLLPQGNYRFEGYTRTRGAGVEPMGAHLRVSGMTAMPVLHGDAEWTMLSFAFEVPEASREVVLICELRGNSGEAWFDTTSLKIRRVE